MGHPVHSPFLGQTIKQGQDDDEDKSPDPSPGERIVVNEDKNTVSVSPAR